MTGPAAKQDECARSRALMAQLMAQDATVPVGLLAARRRATLVRSARECAVLASVLARTGLHLRLMTELQLRRHAASVDIAFAAPPRLGCWCPR